MDKVRDEEITLYHNKNLMREYRIVRTDLGWNIYRKKQIGKLFLLHYLNGKLGWSVNKGFAKIFYHKEDAVSALMVIKKRDEGESTN